MSVSRLLALVAVLLTPAVSFAAMNASQTMVIQTGATERARINTNGIETTRVSATYISTTLVQASGTPTANNHLATKAYVDAAVAAAGSGRPKYMGVTGSSYNGLISGSPGIITRNSQCNAAYPGSRMMMSTDVLLADYSDATPSVFGWIHCEACVGANADTGNCNAWSSSSASYYALTLSTGGSINRSGCGTSYPIHCVKD